MNAIRIHLLLAGAVLLGGGFPPAALRAQVGQLAQAPAPETLSLRDLANRPERWPAQVTLKRDFRFSGGAAVRTGQAVKVVEFAGARVTVDGGNQLFFDIGPEDCDLLEGANLAWKALTPAQRAVDPALLAKDASLWPERATCIAGFQLEDGSELAPGSEYEFLSLAGQEVNLYSREHKTTLVAELGQTDLIARARQRALIEPDQRSSRIAAALGKNLVDAKGKPFAGEVGKASVYALYFGASWCGPCRKFSPGLVKFMNETAAQNPRLLTVLLSSDQKDPDMLEYMSDEKMPWPAMPLATLNQTPLLASYSIGSIPHLVIVDRYGKVLTSSMQNGRYVGPDKALTDLKQLLASGIAR